VRKEKNNHCGSDGRLCLTLWAHNLLMYKCLNVGVSCQVYFAEVLAGFIYPNVWWKNAPAHAATSGALNLNGPTLN